jgi:hypothetical protein
MIEADGTNVIEVLPGDCVSQVFRPAIDPLTTTAVGWKLAIDKALDPMAKDADQFIEDRR